MKAEPGRNNTSTHPFTISDGEFKYGLTLKDDFYDQPHTASSINVQSGGTAYGEWGPFTSEEQSDWHGGRAQEKLEDSSQYLDSRNLWTLTENKMFPSMKWKFAKGIRNSDFYMPGNVSWFKLLSAGKYLSASFVASASYNANKIMLWVRRVGSPNTLTAAIYSDSSGVPGTLVVSQTVNTTVITDTVSVLHQFVFDSDTALVSGTTYHVVVYGSSLDNDASHWEVAVDNSETSSKKTTDGVNWYDSLNAMYYRVTDVDSNMKLHLFELEGMWYAVSEPDDGSNSKIWMNGYRGVATSATDSTLVDTNATWTTNALVGMKVRLISGKKAAKRQLRTITANDATSITIGEDWVVNPTSTSQYVIYGKDTWILVTPTTTAAVPPVYDVAIMNKIAYFALGDSEKLTRFRWSGAFSTGHQMVQESNYADLLHTYVEPTTGTTRLYRALNSSSTNFSRSSLKAWGTDLSFSDDKSFGDPTYEIVNIFDYNGQMWGIKEDSIWKLESDIPQKVNVGIDALPSWLNGQAVCTQGLYMYFSFGQSIERLQGTTLDDVGPTQGTGLPENHKGTIVTLEPVISWIFAGVDAGEDGYSSVLAYNQIGYHEIFSGWKGARVRNLKWQPVYGGRPKLWINVNGELVYQEFPEDGLHPLTDDGVEFQHEAVYVSSTIDLAHTSLKKAFRNISLINSNSDTIKVYLDYQMDDDVNSDNWIYSGMFNEANRDKIDISLGSKIKIRFRLRLQTSGDGIPPVVDATVVEIFERIEEKRQLTLRVYASEFSVDALGNQDADPEELYQWMLAKQNEADVLFMESIYENWHNKKVIIDNVIPTRSNINIDSGLPVYLIQVTFREA